MSADPNLANPALEKKLMDELEAREPLSNWHTVGWRAKAIKILEQVFQERDEQYPEQGPFPGATKHFPRAKRRK
jgi:hypothetical protein